jgi:glucokinase
MRAAIGVDVGGTKIRAARVDSAGTILAHWAVATPATIPGVLAAIDSAIVELDSDDVGAIGVGAPGRVDVRKGEVLSGGFVNLAGPPLATRLDSLAGRPLFVDNDGTMALVGEARVGAGEGAENLLMLTIGTGIGGATMIDGKILRGAGSAGQLGHLTVAYGGAPCVCGRLGCLETMSSGTALRRLIDASRFGPTATAASLLADESEDARALLLRWAGPLREGIDSYIAAFDPERIVLGGGLGEAAVEALARIPGKSYWFQRPVVAARLGDRAGVIGAALAALEAAR